MKPIKNRKQLVSKFECDSEEFRNLDVLTNKISGFPILIETQRPMRGRNELTEYTPVEQPTSYPSELEKERRTVVSVLKFEIYCSRVNCNFDLLLGNIIIILI